MSNSVQRHKLKNKLAMQAALGESDDVFFGAASQDAQVYANLAANLIQAGGGIAAAEMKKKEDKEREEKEKERNKEGLKAQADAAAARKKAQMMSAEALGEADPNGPLHAAAAKAETEARVAEAKAAIFRSNTMSPQQQLEMARAMQLPRQSGMPWWGWLAIGLGTVFTGALAYKLVRK